MKMFKKIKSIICKSEQNDVFELQAQIQVLELLNKQLEQEKTHWIDNTKLYEAKLVDMTKQISQIKLSPVDIWCQSKGYKTVKKVYKDKIIIGDIKI
ncbi:MAG: hypothetical protein AABY22_36465, partial [Nanoarchaeota archaeon]